MRSHDQRRPPLPEHLTQAEREFYQELRRLVDAAGLSFRALEEATSASRSESGGPHFYSKSQWGRWLNGQSLPPRKAVRKLVEMLAEEEIEAEHLVELWGRAFVPRGYPQEPGNTLARPHQLPIALQNFIGRDTQLTLLTGLAEQVAGHGASAVIVIEGTAGVGKTRLAIQSGHLIRDRFPDGQLYVNMYGFGGMSPMSGDEALRGFLDALGVSPKSASASAVEQAALYRSLVADKRVLVVIDNAADAEQVRPLLPAGAGCLAIVTSRNRLTGLVAEGAQTLRLDPFTVAEAYDLMNSRLGSDRVQREHQQCSEPWDGKRTCVLKETEGAHGRDSQQDQTTATTAATATVARHGPPCGAGARHQDHHRARRACNPGAVEGLHRGHDPLGVGGLLHGPAARRTSTGPCSPLDEIAGDRRREQPTRPPTSPCP